MNSDRGAKADQTSQKQSLPPVPRRLCTPDTKEQGQSSGADAATETGAVVRDQWNQMRVDGLELGTIQAHECQIGGYKHDRGADGENHQPSAHQAEGDGQE